MTPAIDRPAVTSARVASYGLAIVTLLNFLNYVDRYVLVAVIPRLKTDLAISDFQIGLIGDAFLITYFLTSPVFGRLGDLVETGPTCTNVNDFRAILVDRP